ncbi:MAG: YggT family protein [Gemmatimonadales bacterium]
MPDVLIALAVLAHWLRVVLLAGGVVCAAVAAGDWAVRTRRLNPFSAIARFMRARVDPWLSGIERQVARTGGTAASVPWWALVAYVVCAALLIAAADGVGSLIVQAINARSLGATGLLLLAVRWTFGFLQIALIVRVVASWLPRLAASRWLSWSFGATEWMLRPLRRVIPAFGVIDITPIVAYFALIIVEYLVETILLAMMG